MSVVVGRPRTFLPIIMVAGLTAGLLAAAPAQAAVMQPVSSDAAGASQLAEALVANRSVIRGARFDAVPPFGSPHAVSGRLSHFPTAGDDFAVLTTGSAQAADDDNVSGSFGRSLGGGSVRGNTDRDATVLAVDLEVPAGRNCLRFDASTSPSTQRSTPNTSARRSTTPSSPNSTHRRG